MLVDTTHRSGENEIMDDLDMSGDILISTLDQIARINRWLGGNALTISGLKSLLNSQPVTDFLSIVDLGCGNGDLLRLIADFGRKNNFTFKLLGIDANLTTIEYARSLSTDYPEITYLKEDVCSNEFRQRKYDIALLTLFLHHFEEQEALTLIKSTLSAVSTGIIVNDLHRHPLPYYLFKLLTMGMKNKMVKADGLTSILRGFKKTDLEDFAEKIKYPSTISWKWAFRYQWIIRKNECKN